MSSCSDLLQINLFFSALNLEDLKANRRLFCSTFLSTIEARCEVEGVLGVLEDKYE
jgi:hypothetical protein